MTLRKPQSLEPKKVSLNRLVVPFLASLTLALGLPLVCPVAQFSPAACAANDSNTSRQKLQQIEKKREEVHRNLLKAREKERQALKQLKEIKKKLNATTGELNVNKRQLEKTEVKINETQAKISKTQSAESDLSGHASKRLREIYEGQRLSFLEMLFQVESLQTLLDRFYFQERVAEQDRKLLNELRAREASLSHQKGELGQKRNQLGDIVSEIAQKAMEIAKQKLGQEQIAEKLRKQRALYEQAERQLASESHRLESQILEMENSHRRNAKGNMAVGSGNMCMPLRAPVTSPFGYRRHPIFGGRRFHTGVDLAGPNRSAIRAADSGNVLFTGWYGGYGKVVIISHGKGMATLYAHLSKAAVAVGDNIGKGDVIGYEGTTGFSTGPHLHFEVRVNGKPNNPLNFVR